MAGNRGTIAGSIVALVGAAIGLAVAFGVHVTTSERDAIVSFVTAAIAVAPLVGAAFDHGRRQADARVRAATTIAAAQSASPPVAASGR